MLHKQDQEAGPHPRTEFLSLLQFLQAERLYESAQESLQREEVLGQLNDLVREWVKQVARVLAYDEDAIEAANGRIFTFGSYRLGVHGPGGIRVDLGLCLPRCICATRWRFRASVLCNCASVYCVSAGSTAQVCLLIGQAPAS